jgi:hypothetical protein
VRAWVPLASERRQSLANDVYRIHPDSSLAKDELNRLSVALEKLNWLDPSPSQERAPKSRWAGLDDWWSGSLAQDTWLKLHLIEEGVEAARPDHEEVLRHARDHLLGDAKATKKLNDDIKAAPEKAKKGVAVDALKRAHQKSHQKHIDERQRHRAMVIFAGSLCLGAAAVWLLQTIKFDDTPFLVLPNDAETTATIGAGSLLFLVMLFGAIGGLLSGLISLYLTAKTVDDTMWFDPRPTLAVIKVAMGIWTAFLGVLMVGTGLVVGNYTSIPSAIILAFLFGYGQQAVTGVLLDRHVGKLTKETPS